MMTLLIGTGYAISDEWHQSFVPGRDASAWDVFFDMAGNGMGGAIYPFVRRSILRSRGRSGKRKTA